MIIRLTKKTKKKHFAPISFSRSREETDEAMLSIEALPAKPSSQQMTVHITNVPAPYNRRASDVA